MPHHNAAYSTGGAQSTIYAMFYTFYEDMNDYRMAALEYKRAQAERKIEAMEKSIEVKNEKLASQFSSNFNEVTKSATTAATISFSSVF